MWNIICFLVYALPILYLYLSIIERGRTWCYFDPPFAYIISLRVFQIFLVTFYWRSLSVGLLGNYVDKVASSLLGPRICYSLKMAQQPYFFCLLISRDHRMSFFVIKYVICLYFTAFFNIVNISFLLVLFFSSISWQGSWFYLMILAIFIECKLFLSFWSCFDSIKTFCVFHRNHLLFALQAWSILHDSV